MSQTIRIPRRVLAPPPEALELTRNAIKIYGQSWSTASSNTPAITTTPPNPTYMKSFNTGIRTRNDGGLIAPGYLTSIIPAREYSDPFSFSEETIACGTMQRIIYELGNLHLFASCCGKGGEPISSLNKGTNPYANSATESRYLRQLSTDLRAVTRAVCWLQGESDRNRTAAAYMADLTQLIADYNADQLRDAVQNSIPLWFTCQTSSHTQPSTALPGVIANFAGPEAAKFDMANNNEIVLVTPTYILPYASDGIHLESAVYKRLGEYFGLAIAKTLGGTRWQHLRPTVINRPLPGILDVTFEGQDGILALDTTNVTASPGSGFSCVVSGADSFPVVSILASDTIRLTGVPLTAFNLRYGFNMPPGSTPGPTTGARGNLRDSVAIPSILGYPDLYKWCPLFDIPVP